MTFRQWYISTLQQQGKTVEDAAADWGVTRSAVYTAISRAPDHVNMRTLRRLAGSIGLPYLVMLSSWAVAKTGQSPEEEK